MPGCPTVLGLPYGTFYGFVRHLYRGTCLSRSVPLPGLTCCSVSGTHIHFSEVGQVGFSVADYGSVSLPLNSFLPCRRPYSAYVRICYCRNRLASFTQEWAIQPNKRLKSFLLRSQGSTLYGPTGVHSCLRRHVLFSINQQTGVPRFSRARPFFHTVHGGI